MSPHGEPGDGNSISTVIAGQSSTPATTAASGTLAPENFNPRDNSLIFAGHEHLITPKIQTLINALGLEPPTASQMRFPPELNETERAIVIKRAKKERKVYTDSINHIRREMGLPSPKPSKRVRIAVAVAAAATAAASPAEQQGRGVEDLENAVGGQKKQKTTHLGESPNQVPIEPGTGSQLAALQDEVTGLLAELASRENGQELKDAEERQVEASELQVSLVMGNGGRISRERSKGLNDAWLYYIGSGRKGLRGILTSKDASSFWNSSPAHQPVAGFAGSLPSSTATYSEATASYTPKPAPPSQDEASASEHRNSLAEEPPRARDIDRRGLTLYQVKRRERRHRKSANARRINDCALRRVFSASSVYRGRTARRWGSDGALSPRSAKQPSPSKENTPDYEEVDSKQGTTEEFLKYDIPLPENAPCPQDDNFGELMSMEELEALLEEFYGQGRGV
ncbi:hypothetical protein QBC40DRAFT_291625 [Triangularia verruculosa]|uniref:Uncharacterized protein n=1 Tax=Triangularia verruculosa TaxID=2587418 RepID=A0AAN6XRM0_9PEZI|nr:hypothetical protein QBC40DRAFT_291625 [Triangularia verruculosa]